jgi:hypothetical protein
MVAGGADAAAGGEDADEGALLGGRPAVVAVARGGGGEIFVHGRFLRESTGQSVAETVRVGKRFYQILQILTQCGPATEEWPK